MFSGHTDNFKFVAEAAGGLLSGCRIQRSPDPFCKVHVTRPSSTLDISTVILRAAGLARFSKARDRFAVPNAFWLTLPMLTNPFAQFFMVRIVPRPSKRSSLVTRVKSMT